MTSYTDLQLEIVDHSALVTIANPPANTRTQDDLTDLQKARRMPLPQALQVDATCSIPRTRRNASMRLYRNGLPNGSNT